MSKLRSLLKWRYNITRTGANQPEQQLSWQIQRSQFLLQHHQHKHNANVGCRITKSPRLITVSFLYKKINPITIALTPLFLHILLSCLVLLPISIIDCTLQLYLFVKVNPSLFVLFLFPLQSLQLLYLLSHRSDVK